VKTQNATFAVVTKFEYDLWVLLTCIQ